MKKLKGALVALSLLSTVAFASTDIDLTVGYVDPIPSIPGHGKSPITMPEVELDGSQLLFSSPHADYTLELLVGDVVVYSTFVPSATTTVNLPAYLEGQYEIRLYDGTPYYYYGYISLPI